jgi:hypothetical protein
MILKAALAYTFKHEIIQANYMVVSDSSNSLEQANKIGACDSISRIERILCRQRSCWCRLCRWLSVPPI